MKYLHILELMPFNSDSFKNAKRNAARINTSYLSKIMNVTILHFLYMVFPSQNVMVN